MVWGCMAANGTGGLKLLSEMINGIEYINVLEKKILPNTLPGFLMSIGFFKITMRLTTMTKKCSVGAELIKLKECTAKTSRLKFH